MLQASMGRRLVVWCAAAAAPLVLSGTACGWSDEQSDPLSTDAPRPRITVAEATAQSETYLVDIVGGERARASSFTGQIGCGTDPGSLMSQGPPWKTQIRWIRDNPSPEFVAGALGRVDALMAEGFTAQPWRRPDAPPPNHRSLRDERGYSIGTGTETQARGVVVFEVTVTSPCADE